MATPKDKKPANLAEDIDVTCPGCGLQFAANDSIDAHVMRTVEGVIAEERRKFNDEVTRHNRENTEEREKLRMQKDGIEAELTKRMRAERMTIAEEERKRLEGENAALLKAERDRARDAETRMKTAQAGEIAVRKEMRALEDDKAEWELEKTRQLDADRKAIRQDAQAKADEANRLKLAEKDKMLSDLGQKLQEAQRKAELGSQQAQGEVLELDLEAELRARFPMDEIVPVPKGQHGGDVVQRVKGPGGLPCGTILWEAKRTQNWSDAWLGKLKRDGQAAGAEVTVLLSQALPKEVKVCEEIEGVWVLPLGHAAPVACLLRAGLIETATARRAAEGQDRKMALLHAYLTSTAFRHRMEAIIDSFTTMQDDLKAEKRGMVRIWAKREKALDAVLENVSGMYGDLQGLMGASLPELDALSLAALPAGEEDEAVYSLN